VTPESEGLPIGNGLNELSRSTIILVAIVIEAMVDESISKGYLNAKSTNGVSKGWIC
jgi:hypothetical protein